MKEGNAENKLVGNFYTPIFMNNKEGEMKNSAFDKIVENYRVVSA